jgi:hypothetical protein
MPVIQLTEPCHFQPNVCWPHERITEASMSLYQQNPCKPNDRIMPLSSKYCVNKMPEIQMTESCHFQPNVCWPHERITETSMNIYEPNARKPNDRIMPL